MFSPREQFVQSRRNFLATSASGVGLLAVASLMREQGLLASDDVHNPLAIKPPHFPPKAKSCIFIYLEGGPSQMDLFDPKPTLQKLHKQKLPESLTKNVRFAFLQKDSATVLASPRVFKKHGKCGMDFSDYLPNISTHADDICMIRSMHTEAFNHHPGQLLMNTGSQMFGRPSIGAWLTYGLGSESKNLPGYVVLNSGRGTSGGTSNWGSGFLPTHFQGTLFRNQGDPILNLANPPGMSSKMQEETIAAISRMNRLRHEEIRDPEINSRIATYELAFRMQSAAPELIDLKGESRSTLEAYGLERTDPDMKAHRGGGKGQYHSFALNCLLARRLVERGVRFINLFHASWDHHSNLDEELKFNCGMADQPISALLTDLKQRGLLDSTLIVWGTEFGRTPLGENRAGTSFVTGRDHHPFAFTIWMAGGGSKPGTIYGKTDDLGWNIIENPVHINDFHATMLHLFGFDHKKLTYRFQGRDFRLTDLAGKVVNELIA